MVKKYNSGFSFKLQTNLVPLNEHTILKNLSPRKVRSNFRNPTQSGTSISHSFQKCVNKIEKEVHKKCYSFDRAKAHRTSPNSGLIFTITKTLLCVRCRASLTVEAAMAVPVFVFFLVLFLGLFRVLLVESQMNQALGYTASKFAMETTSYYDTYEAVLIKQLKELGCAEEYIDNGMKGIVVTNRKSDEQYIRLSVTYDILLPVNVFGKQDVEVTQYAVARRWTGYEEDDLLSNQWVYITPFGAAYHKSASCSYLDLSLWAVSESQAQDIRNKNGGKYYKCSFCTNVTDTIPLDTVYVTDYGTLYHESLECKSLKRTVLRVKLENVQGRSPCKKCG